MTNKEKEVMLTKILSTPKGMKKLGEAMDNPLRKMLNYTSIARRIMVVDPIPQGALPMYDEDGELIDEETLRIENKGW